MPVQPASGLSRWISVSAVVALGLSACAAPGSTGEAAEVTEWSAVLEQARGQTVRLWMWGGDEQGNAYVDEVLAPAARDQLGVVLERVPVADTADAVTRVLAERQAGAQDGNVDLVWVNGDNFRTGQQAGAWLCGWADELPSMRYTTPDDPLLESDFGTAVEDCESPWHKAQFTLVYDSEAVADPPSTMAGVLAWAEAVPGQVHLSRAAGLHRIGVRSGGAAERVGRRRLGARAVRRVGLRTADAHPVAAIGRAGSVALAGRCHLSAGRVCAGPALRRR